MKNNLSRILSMIMLLSTIQNLKARNLEKIYKYQCEEKNVTLTTSVLSKNKYFFFRLTNHKKIKRIDKVVDENGNVIIRTIMRSNEKGDKYSFNKFHRLVIIGKEIHEVICVTGKENGKLIIYNFCGEKINEQNVKSEELLEKYKF